MGSCQAYGMRGIKRESRVTQYGNQIKKTKEKPGKLYGRQKERESIRDELLNEEKSSEVFQPS